MDFQKQIKHPKWQKKRLEILERDNYYCTFCGNSESQLHVHHLIYYKDTMLWEYENNCLITLCESCHNDWHQTNDEIKEMIKEAGYLNQIRNTLRLIYKKDPREIYDLNEIIEKILDTWD